MNLDTIQLQDGILLEAVNFFWNKKLIAAEFQQDVYQRRFFWHQISSKPLSQTCPFSFKLRSGVIDIY